MSKKLLFYFIPLLCSQMSSAQKQLIIKAGLAYSGVKETYADPYENKSPKYGFQTGLSYDVLTKDNFVFRPGLQLTHANATIKLIKKHEYGEIVNFYLHLL